MPTHGKEIPLLKRVAILTLHWHGNKNWAEISSLLKVHPETARQICVRAKEQASDPSDFDDVLLHLENVERAKNRESKESQVVEPKEIVVGNEDYSAHLVKERAVCTGDIEGLTAMRDMDWR